MPLTEFVPGQIWLREYPVAYAGSRFNARMSVVRLRGDDLMLHSPCAMDDMLVQAISGLGRVVAIVAPGNFHHLHVASAQARFPAARTYICPGVERRAPGLRYDAVLGERPPPEWNGAIAQALVRGGRCMREVAMLHVPSKTLLLVDALENFTDRTAGVNWQVKGWFTLFRMWNRPKPAPEYRLGWRDRAAARASFERILAWDFERIVVSHGDNIVADAKAVAHAAWTPPLAPGD